MKKKKALKIGIDVRCLMEGRMTGVEEYTINLLRNLFEVDQRNRYVLFTNSLRKPKGNLEMFAEYKNVTVRNFRFPNKALNLFFWYFGWPYADKMIGGADLFFMPNINFIGLSKKTKLVLTMHDLSFEHMPEMFSVKRRIWHSFVNPRRLCKKANLVLAVSDSTRSDLVANYGISPERVCRIYSGVSDEYAHIDRNDKKLVEVKEKYRLPFKFIFFLGTIEPRKNIASLVRAFDRLKDLAGNEKLKLVVAGSRGWKSEKTIEALKKAKHTKDIIFISNVPNRDKTPLYNLATAFVYPSFLEGFGFPVLEAMKCGVPVIASNTSSIPEVVGSEGILIDPEKPDEIYVALRDLLGDSGFCKHFQERGKRRTVIFSWRNTAREFLRTVEDRF